MNGRQREVLSVLRGRAVEWHRRGMRSPTEIAAMVELRIAHRTPATDDPTYGDFFRDA